MQLASSGGRRLRHAALAARKLALEDRAHRHTKRTLGRAREAGKALELRPAQRAVLSELVACWGEQEWERLLVWPSNDYLMSRTGLTERAIRRILQAADRPSADRPEGLAQRQALCRQGPGGQIVDAFGFDLTPVYARRGEWGSMLMEQKQLREVQKRAFDEVTICRRAAEEALSALAEHFPPSIALTSSPAQGPAGPHATSVQHTLPADLLDAWQLLRSLCEEAFYEAGNAGLGVLHTNNNNGSPSELVTKAFRRKLRRFVQTNKPRSTYHRN
jgi:replication initiation protein RepC